MAVKQLPVRYRSAFQDDSEFYSRRSEEAYVVEPSLTVQSQAEEADINTLMRRFHLTGKMPENPRIPSYYNEDQPFDFRTAQAQLRDVGDMFSEYPAELRTRFNNDPAIFADFCLNPENLPEMRKLGLAKPTADLPPATPLETPPAPAK